MVWILYIAVLNSPRRIIQIAILLCEWKHFTNKMIFIYRQDYLCQALKRMNMHCFLDMWKQLRIINIFYRSEIFCFDTCFVFRCECICRWGSFFLQLDKDCSADSHIVVPIGMSFTITYPEIRTLSDGKLKYVSPYVSRMGILWHLFRPNDKHACTQNSTFCNIYVCVYKTLVQSLSQKIL